jgi:hypothetical protein
MEPKKPRNTFTAHLRITSELKPVTFAAILQTSNTPPPSETATAKVFFLFSKCDVPFYVFIDDNYYGEEFQAYA